MQTARAQQAAADARDVAALAEEGEVEEGIAGFGSTEPMTNIPSERNSEYSESEFNIKAGRKTSRKRAAKGPGKQSKKKKDSKHKHS